MKKLMLLVFILSYGLANSQVRSSTFINDSTNTQSKIDTNDVSDIGIPNIYGLIAFFSPIGFQREFASKTPNLGNSFDLSFTGVATNFGYNYKSGYGSSAYVGVGVGCLLQVQYGYQFENVEHLIKVRSDFPLILVGLEKDNFLSAFSVGLYYVNSNKNISYNNSYGFSVSASGAMVIVGLVEVFN